MTPTRCTPCLSRSQLAFRIGLARKRTASYPLHTLDFILIDLERPDNAHRHADWCAGDLSGRVLEFLSVAEGIDGTHDSRLPELFQRIYRTRRPSGLFGRFGGAYGHQYDPPEADFTNASHRLFNGLIKYYDLTGDTRALDSAVGLADHALAHKDDWAKWCASWSGCTILYWITEPLAELYRITGDKKYLTIPQIIGESIKDIYGMHSHGFLTTMRGLQLAALYTGDASWNDVPERFRRIIIDTPYEFADGCVAETFPRSFRNEGCSIADWILVNLNATRITGNLEGYEHAENALWNALFFNQFITGGFGHRDLSPDGYKMGPMSECWWCCTENGGLAMAEFARHTVTLDGDTLRINFLTPGTFTVSDAHHAAVSVDIRTAWPARGEAHITVTNLPETMTVDFRTPKGLHQPTVTQTRTGQTVVLRIAGHVGHHIETIGDRVLLKYGPAILAPMTYYWDNSGCKTENTNAPAGYIAETFPGIPHLAMPIDADGRCIGLSDQPYPDWCYFESGPGAELAIDGASVNVPVRFADGQTKVLWFAPLCHLTSDMSYYDTPILFPK
jgi:hypothetical protein